jgi:hypothetical protein
MSRSTLTRTTVVLFATVLLAPTLVSAVLAATTSSDPAKRITPAPVLLEDADAGQIFDMGVAAAAGTLAISSDELVGQLADGASLKQIADARDVGYGTVARAVNDAVSTALAASVANGSLSRQRAEGIRSVLTAWVDAGGQPDGRPTGNPG